MSKHLLVAGDIGATKCAAAIVEYDTKTDKFQCKKQFVSKLKNFHSLSELFQAIEFTLDMKMSDAEAIGIGAAGMYDGETLHLESGYPFSMSFAKLAKECLWPSFAVIHDYAPIICSTFTSHIKTPGNIKKLNSANMNIYGRRVAVGVGTGLGGKDGVLFPDGDFWLGTNEVGHIGISDPPLVDAHLLNRHRELMLFLRTNNILDGNGQLTFEKILSGQGMVRLHQFLHPSETAITPEAVGQKIRDGEARETLALFAWYLGLFISTVQLAFMPDGGIWITGGVVQHHLNVFDLPEFYDGFHASPAYVTQRNELPIAVLCHPDHALIGGAYYAAKKLLNL